MNQRVASTALAFLLGAWSGPAIDKTVGYVADAMMADYELRRAYNAALASTPCDLKEASFQVDFCRENGCDWLKGNYSPLEGWAFVDGRPMATWDLAMKLREYSLMPH